MRTTINIDAPILKELKKLGKIEGKSLGRMISDLLSQALQRRKTVGRPAVLPQWISRNMRARINLNDKEALYTAPDDQRNSADIKNVKL
jgi:hypothetical protein